MPVNLDHKHLVHKMYTTIAQGYSNKAFVGREMCTLTPVQSLVGKYYEFGKARFRDVGEKINRPLNSPPQQHEWTPPTERSFGLTIQSLEVAAEQKAIDEYKSVDNIIQSQLDEKLELIRLREEIDIKDTLLNADSYERQHSKTLTTKWTDKTDIAKEIDSMSNMILGKVGVVPNRLLLSNDVYTKAFKPNKTILESIKYSQKGILTTDLIASFLGLDRIVVGQGLYETSGGKLEFLWKNCLVLAYVEPQSKNRNKPTHTRLFQLDKHPTVIKGNPSYRDIQLYRLEDAKQIAIVDKKCGFLLKDVVA